MIYYLYCIYIKYIMYIYAVLSVYLHKENPNLNVLRYAYLPVVPHKAVAEVSRIGNYRRDWLL